MGRRLRLEPPCGLEWSALIRVNPRLVVLACSAEGEAGLDAGSGFRVAHRLTSTKRRVDLIQMTRRLRMRVWKSVVASTTASWSWRASPIAGRHGSDRLLRGCARDKAGREATDRVPSCPVQAPRQSAIDRPMNAKIGGMSEEVNQPAKSVFPCEREVVGGATKHAIRSQ